MVAIACRRGVASMTLVDWEVGAFYSNCHRAYVGDWERPVRDQQESSTDGTPIEGDRRSRIRPIRSSRSRLRRLVRLV
jgi:hypothetical protein